jgi:hypothetical protein
MLKHGNCRVLQPLEHDASGPIQLELPFSWIVVIPVARAAESQQLVLPFASGSWPHDVSSPDSADGFSDGTHRTDGKRSE